MAYGQRGHVGAKKNHEERHLHTAGEVPQLAAAKRVPETAGYRLLIVVIEFSVRRQLQDAERLAAAPLDLVDIMYRAMVPLVSPGLVRRGFVRPSVFAGFQ